MRYNVCTLVLLCLATFFTSCSKNKSSIEYKSEFDKSYDAWVDFKSGSGNKYQYTVDQSSVFGFSSKTTITVSDGKITTRKYASYKREGAQQVLTREWTEDRNTLNTHTEGAATITLDEIYSRAKNDWLIKRKDAKVYFESRNNGMLSTVGYVLNGCIDDCFNGIYITSIIKQ